MASAVGIKKDRSEKKGKELEKIAFKLTGRMNTDWLVDKIEAGLRELGMRKHCI